MRVGQTASARRLGAVLDLDHVIDPAMPNGQIRAPLAYTVQRLNGCPDLAEGLDDLGLIGVNGGASHSAASPNSEFWTSPAPI